MLPSPLAQSQRQQRHVAASANVLATRLMRNTVERATIGNTPLHALHLCDARFVAPLFASCVSLTVMTIHLKYVVSSTALEVLLCAAATSPTLRQISVVGGVTSMEAAAMVSGLAAFTWSSDADQNILSCVDTAPPPRRPPTAHRLPPTQVGRPFSGGRCGGRGLASPHASAASHQSPALSPYARPHSFTRQQLPRYANLERSAPLPPGEIPRTTQCSSRASAARWPVHYPVSPRIALVSCPESLASSPHCSCPSRNATPPSAHTVKGAICLTLELHRLEEATAAMLLDGLRSARRVLSAEVRLCVATAEARRIGHRLAREAKRVAAQHRQQRLMGLMPPAEKAVVSEGCFVPATWEGRGRSGRFARSQHLHGLQTGPQRKLCTPTPPSPAPLQRPPSSLRPAALVGQGPRCRGQEGRGTRPSAEKPLSFRQMARPQRERHSPKSLAVGILHPHRRLGTPRDIDPSQILSPYFSTGTGATLRPHHHVLHQTGPITEQASRWEAFRRRPRQSPSPLLAGMDADTHFRLASWRRHLARTGRLYSPPRWTQSSQKFANVGTPHSLPPSHVKVSSPLGGASTSSTSSPALQRLELSASLTSSWSSRSSSPMPRPPLPSSRGAAVAFANFVARERAAGTGKREDTKGPTPQTPPEVMSAPLPRGSICRGITSSASELRSPPCHARVLCSPRYFPRSGTDGVDGEAEQNSPPASPPLSPQSSSRCSCFVCRSHSTSFLVAGTPLPSRPAPSGNSARQVASPVESATRTLCPSLPTPQRYFASSSLSEQTSPTSPAQDAGRTHQNARTLMCGDGGVVDITPARYSVTTSVNDITPPQKQEGEGRVSRSSLISCDTARSESASSRLTGRGVKTLTGSVYRSINMAPEQDNLVSVRHSGSHARMASSASRSQDPHLQILHTQLPSSVPLEPLHEQHQPLSEEAGYVVYPNSVAFLRARVTEINRHVVWHQVQANKAAESHSKRLVEMGVSFADRVTEELSDILMVLTDMEHGSRIEGLR